jgi:hypothetical protein
MFKENKNRTRLKKKKEEENLVIVEVEIQLLMHLSLVREQKNPNLYYICRRMNVVHYFLVEE